MASIIDPLPEPEQPRSATWPACPNTVRAHHEALDRVIDMAEVVDYPGHKHEYGVLYVGGGRYWPGIVVGCRLLRQLGYSGHIQVWHGHNNDTEPVDYSDVANLDVEIVNALDVAKKTKPRILRGWEAKLHAIKNCDIKHLLFLDADAYCVVNPEIFLRKELDPSGFSFWVDLPHATNNVKWHFAYPDQNRSNVPQIQGGQIFIDRQKQWPLIVTADWMNQHSDFYYKHMFGDQDTWRVALSASGWPFHAIGNAVWRSPAFVCFLKNQPFVVHRCRGKLFRIKDIPINRRGYSGPAYSLPREAEIWDILADVLKKDDDPQQVFSHIYSCDLWNLKNSRDKPLQGEAAEYVNIIAALAKVGDWRTAIDAGCGDGRIAKAIVERTGMVVTGLDCIQPPYCVEVDNLYRFSVQDIRDVSKIAPADVILCKDVLHHWPTDMLVSWLKDVIQAKRWKWLVCTQDRHQYGAKDTHLGGYRALSPSEYPLRQFNWTSVIEYCHKAVCLKNLVGQGSL